MRITNGSDPVFDKLVTGKDKYLFNLLYRIREDPGSFLATDDSTCIIARSNPNTPVWISGPSGNRRLSEPMPCRERLREYFFLPCLFRRSAERSSHAESWGIPGE